MGPSSALLFGGPLTSLPGIVGTVLVLLLVIVVGRIVLALAWRVVLVALAVSIALWLLGAVGIGPV
jgi:hypothetical protein